MGVHHIIGQWKWYYECTSNADPLLVDKNGTKALA